MCALLKAFNFAFRNFYINIRYYVKKNAITLFMQNLFANFVDLASLTTGARALLTYFWNFVRFSEQWIWNYAFLGREIVNLPDSPSD